MKKSKKSQQQYNKRYYQFGKEEIIQRVTKGLRENKEKRKQYNKKYYETHGKRDKKIPDNKIHIGNGTN